MLFQKDNLQRIKCEDILFINQNLKAIGNQRRIVKKIQAQKAILNVKNYIGMYWRNATRRSTPYYK